MQRRPLVLLAAGLAVLVAGVLALVVLPGGGSTAAPPSVEVVPVAERRPLPAFSGHAVAPGGGRIDIGALHGHVAVINFWASWCGPCRAEQQALEEASRLLAPAGVRFLGVNVRDEQAAARAHLREFGVTYPSLDDRAGGFVQALRERAPAALPGTIVVDADGRVAASVHGQLPGADPAAQVAGLERVVAEATGVRAPGAGG